MAWLNFQPGCLAFKVDTVGIYDPTKGIYRNLNRFSCKGTSDIIGCYKGNFFAMEVKTPERRKYVSSDQIRFIQRVQTAQGYASVVTCVEDAQALLQHIDQLS